MSRFFFPRVQILIKNSLTNKRPNNLRKGELAYSFASGDSGQTLYIGSADSGVSFAIGGAFFTDMLDHTKGVLTPSSAIITDANNKIDKLIVDNTTIDSADIRTDGNLSLLPSGGSVLVSGDVRVTGQFVGVYAGFDSDFGLKTTDDLTEGSTNLYYTSARSDSDTTDLVDSAYIRARQLTDLPYVDSAMVSRMIDSATGGIDSAVLTRIINLQTIDSAQVDQMLDSAIGAFGIDSASVDQMIDSALQFASTNSRPGQHGLIDSQDVDQMIDSAVSKTHIDTLEIDAGTLDGINSTQFLRSDQDDTISANLTVDSNLVIGGQLQGPANFIIDPATVGDNTGTVQILGNLTVQGTQTTINSTTVSLNDKNLVLADSAADSAAADGAGLTINGAGATLTYSASLDDFVFNKPITAPNINVDTITVTETIVGGYAGFDSDFNQKTTDNLTEGSTNLYHTKARVQTLLDSSGHLDSNATDQMIDSAIGFLSANSRPGIHGLLDSTDIDQMLDSAFSAFTPDTSAFTANALDSSGVDQMLDSALGFIQGARVSFNVGHGGSGNYQFTGDGFPASVANPALYLTRGVEYYFYLNVSGHPFYIKTVNSTGTGNQYTDGVTGNGSVEGALIFNVPMDAPNVLHYNCQNHSAMNGPIYIMDQNSFVDSDEVDRMIDSAITGPIRTHIQSFNFIDSNAADQMIDSAMTQVGANTRLLIDSNKAPDSASINNMIDVRLIQTTLVLDSNATDQMIDSAIGFLSTNSRPGIHGLIDSVDVDQMIDSAITGPIRSHIQAFGFLDSNLIDQMFDSHQSNVTHGGGGGGGGLDSTAVDQMFDSHLSNVLHSGGAGGGLDSNPVQRMIDSNGGVDSTGVDQMIDSAIGFLSTNSRPGVHGLLDSNAIDQMLDSAFNAFTPATSTFTAHALDSNAVDQMFDSHLSNVLHGGTGGGLDSNAIEQMLDSHEANTTHGGSGTGGLDSAEVIRITTGTPTALTYTNFTVTADSNQGEFTRDSDDNPISIDTSQFQVFLNGLLLPEDEYTSTSSSITLRTVTDSGDQLQVVKTNGNLSPLNQTIFEFAVESDNTTTFTGSDRNSRSLTFNNSNQQSVFINGILQTSEDFSINTSTNTLTLNVGADSGDLVQIVRLSGTSLSNGLDSTAVDQMFDSHLSNVLHGGGVGSLDSNAVDQMFDSAVGFLSTNSRPGVHGLIDSLDVDQMLDSAVGFLSTNSRPGVHGLLDSNDIDQMLDSAFGAFTPATATFTAHALDSNAVDQMFDSHLSNVTHGGGGGGGLDSAAVRLIADSGNPRVEPVEFKQTQFFFRADSVERDFFADSDGNALSLDSGAFQVYLNGILLPQMEYHNTKTSFHLATSADSGDNINLIKFTGNNVELTKRGLTETKFFYTTASPTTSITGADDNGLTLDYSTGLIDVFLNGILLKDSDDFTTNGAGNTVTLVSQTDSNDLVTIVNRKGVVVTPSLKTFEYTATAGQTQFSGLALDSSTLSYAPGAIQVYLNGVLLREEDFSATNGTTVTLTSAAALNDELVISTFSTPGANLTLFKFTASASQTVFSGTDTAGNRLSYMPGNEQVFLNGLLLNDSDDYVATNGVSVILNVAANVNDELKVASFVHNTNNLVVNPWSAPAASNNASAGDKLFVNTLTGAKTVTLPGTASMGDEIRIIDAEGNANNNNITIARNSHKIMAADSDLVINTSRAAVGLVYYNDSNGWLLIEN
jgi:hypothetical protein